MGRGGGMCEGTPSRDSRSKRVTETLGKRRAAKHFREDLLNVFDIHKAYARLDALRHVLLDIRAIRSGREDRLNARAMRRQYLFLESADGEHLPDERDLARHGDVRVDRGLSEQRDERGEQRGARARALLADAALGHVHVHVAVVQDHAGRVIGNAERVRVRFGPAQRDLGTLADDFAQFPCQL